MMGLFISVDIGIVTAREVVTWCGDIGTVFGGLFGQVRLSLHSEKVDEASSEPRFAHCLFFLE